MKANKPKSGISKLKQIPFDYSNMKKNKSLISNNNFNKINPQLQSNYKINNNKKFVTKHNSNYKLAENIKVENNNDKNGFIQNLRNQCENKKYLNIKNRIYNEIFTNKSINDSRPKTTIKKHITNKNYSLNKNNLSSNKNNNNSNKKITSSLEKKVNSYLIPKSIPINKNKNQLNKYTNHDTISNNNKNSKIIKLNSNEKPNNDNILSNFNNINNINKYFNNFYDNNNGIDSQTLNQPKSSIIKNNSYNKNDDFKNNTYLNFIGSNKDNLNILLKNNILENDENLNEEKNNILQNDKTNEHYKEKINIINSGKTIFQKKSENLNTKKEKDEETDINITNKLNNIIENLKKVKKIQMNKFITKNNQFTNDIFDKEKNTEINEYKSKIKEGKDSIPNLIQEQIVKNGIQQKNLELNCINKNINSLNDKQKEYKIKEENKLNEQINPFIKTHKTIYNLNKNKDFNEIINEQSLDINNNNSNILEQINKNDLLQKSNIKYRNFGVINNKFQNSDILKINIENIKNKYIVKKDLDKIIAKKNIPQLITQSLTGLVNLRETCYMNTGLQNLIHCVPFIDNLFSVLDEFREVIEEKIISNSFINLCLSLSKIDNYNLKYNFNSYNPNLFRLNFCQVHKQYSDNEQHDSLEFIRILLDDISKELNQTKIISQYKELSTEGKTKEYQNSEYNEFYLRRENSIIIKIFYSQIMNIFKCECGDISYSFEKILDIPLLFSNDMNNKEINLIDLISKYFEGEELTWNLPCKKCKRKNVKRNKKIQITILPKVLIFSLQRFNPVTGVKINKYINFEEFIDLSSFCDIDFFNGEMNAKYKLFGISNHSGTVNFGHYYSYTKVGNNWYEFNDSIVKLINLSFYSKAAYFFFYEKID